MNLQEMLVFFSIIFFAALMATWIFTGTIDRDTVFHASLIAYGGCVLVGLGPVFAKFYDWFRRKR